MFDLNSVGTDITFHLQTNLCDLTVVLIILFYHIKEAKMEKSDLHSRTVKCFILQAEVLQ